MAIRMDPSTEVARRYTSSTKRTIGPSVPASPSVARSYTVRRLDQVKVLTDPLRQRILGAFMLEPRTTKQIASRLGEKPSKLYHHVDALARAGLLHLKETRQNRGTIEKYFQSVATHFTIDSSIFPSLPDRASRMIDEFNVVLDAIRAGLVGSMEDSSEGAQNGLKPLFQRVVVRASPEKLRECRERLLAVLEECASAALQPGADGEQHLDYAVSVFLTPAVEETEDRSLEGSD